MEDMENKFLKEKIEKLGENVTLPNSLKAENLLSLIENVPQDEPVQPRKENVIHFSKKYMAVAAMLVVAIGFVAIYRAMPKNEMAKMQRSMEYEQSADESMPELAAVPEDTPEGASEEYPESGAQASDKLMMQNDMPQVSSYDAGDFANDEAQTESAPINEKSVAENYSDWKIEGNVLYQNGNNIFEFPSGFATEKYFYDGDTLSVYTQPQPDQPSVYVFSKNDDGDLVLSQSFSENGEVENIIPFGETAVVISTDYENTNVNAYENSHINTAFNCKFKVKDGDIYSSLYGVAISDGKQTAYVFDAKGSFLREAQVDKGKYIDNIDIGKENITLFLSNGEEATFPIKQ